MGHVCNYCQVLKSETDQFWDAKHYCRDCVNSVHPELWEYRQQHTEIRESAPISRANIWKRALQFQLIFSAVVCTFFSVAGFFGMGWPAAFGGLFLAGLICLVQGSIQLPGFVWMTLSQLPTVTIQNGQLTLQRGRNPNPVLQVTLEQLAWRNGKAKRDSGLSNTFIKNQTVLLLLLPCYLGRLKTGDLRIACGWTHETRVLWEAFFELAGIPEQGSRRPFQKKK